MPFFLFGWGSTFAAYVVLQVLTVATLKGAVRYAALLPLPFMIGVAVVTVSAWHNQSNLWPIVMIFASPLALLYLLFVGLGGLSYQRHPLRGGLIAPMLVFTFIGCYPLFRMFG